MIGAGDKSKISPNTIRNFALRLEFKSFLPIKDVKPQNSKQAIAKIFNPT
jgi:hypothetical protein